MSWNPRYLAYCRAHGTPNPEDMLARDRERWPGGAMAGYVTWISACWAEWKALAGLPPREPACDHGPFDRWLSEQHP